MIKRIVYMGYVNDHAIYYDRRKKIPLKAKKSSKSKFMFWPELSLGAAIFFSFSLGKISPNMQPSVENIIFWQIIITSIALYLSYKILYYPTEYEPASYEEFYYAMYNQKIIGDNKNDEVIPLIKGIFVFIFLMIAIWGVLFDYHDMTDGYFSYSKSGSGRLSPFASNFIATPGMLYMIFFFIFIWPFYTIINCFRRFRNRKYINQGKIYQKKP